MNNTITRNVVIAMVVAVLTGTLFWAYRSGKFKTAGKGNEAQDIATLNDPQSKPDQVYRAVLRLGKDQHEEAREYALQNIKNTNAVVRAAAYESLGFYEDEVALKLLSEGMQDSERIVRLATVRGVARKATPGRVQLVQDQLARKDLSIHDTIELQTALTRIGSPELADRAVGELIQIAQKQTGPEASDAAIRVASSAPRDPRVKELYKTKLKSNDPRMVAFAVRHLASAKDADVMQKLVTFSKHDRPEVRMAAVQGAAIACSPDRWSIVKNLFQNEKDEVVLRTVVQSLLIMPSADSETILQEQIAKGSLTPTVMQAAQKALTDLQKLPNKKGCDSSSK